MALQSTFTAVQRGHASGSDAASRMYDGTKRSTTLLGMYAAVLRNRRNSSVFTISGPGVGVRPLRVITPSRHRQHDFTRHITGSRQSFTHPLAAKCVLMLMRTYWPRNSNSCDTPSNTTQWKRHGDARAQRRHYLLRDSWVKLLQHCRDTKHKRRAVDRCRGLCSHKGVCTHAHKHMRNDSDTDNAGERSHHGTYRNRDRTSALA